MINSPWAEGEVAVVFIDGQSNAEGAPATLVPDFTALANVFMMHTAQRTFIPFELLFKSGVGYRNNTYRGRSIPQAAPSTELAKLWQEKIDVGVSLPDLYIITTALGGTGFSTKITLSADRSKWNPYKLKNTTTGTVGPGLFDEPTPGTINQNSSLWKHSQQVKIAAVEEIYRKNLVPRVLGNLVYLGEQDSLNTNSADEWFVNLTHFKNMTDGAIGNAETPFYPVILEQNGRPGEPKINSLSEDFLFANTDSRGIYPSLLPDYVAVSPNYGIFEDGTHYTAAAHRQLIEQFYAASVDSSRFGVVAKRLSY